MSLRLLILGVAAAGLVAAGAFLYLAGRRHAAERLEPRLAAAEAALARREQAHEAARTIAESRLEAVGRTAQAQRALAQPIIEAKTAEDADAPLDSERARRLHDADRRLCDAAPDLAGCAAAGHAP